VVPYSGLTSVSLSVLSSFLPLGLPSLPPSFPSSTVACRPYSISTSPPPLFPPTLSFLLSPPFFPSPFSSISLPCFGPCGPGSFRPPLFSSPLLVSILLFSLPACLFSSAPFCPPWLSPLLAPPPSLASSPKKPYILKPPPFFPLISPSILRFFLLPPLNVNSNVSAGTNVSWFRPHPNSRVRWLFIPWGGGFPSNSRFYLKFIEIAWSLIEKNLKNSVFYYLTVLVPDSAPTLSIMVGHPVARMILKVTLHG
jgi:hypothetical protein